MNWIALASGKRPDYDQPVFLFDEEINKYGIGELREINESKQGRECKFFLGYSSSGEEEIFSNFTHYAIPVPPKKKG